MARIFKFRLTLVKGRREQEGWYRVVAQMQSTTTKNFLSHAISHAVKGKVNARDMDYSFLD